MKIPSTIGSLGAHAAVLTACWLAFGGDLVPGASTREIAVDVTITMNDLPVQIPNSFDPPPMTVPALEPSPLPPIEIVFESEPRSPVAESLPTPPAPVHAIDPDPERPLRDPRALPVAPTNVPAAPAVAETPPRGISTPHPKYPMIARRMGYEGRVVIAFDVAVDGSCADVRVKKSSGHEILDTTALDAVKSWRFEPATVDGLPVALSREIAFTFQLKGEK